jgi:hypothetical protein
MRGRPCGRSGIMSAFRGLRSSEPDRGESGRSLMTRSGHRDFCSILTNDSECAICAQARLCANGEQRGAGVDLCRQRGSRREQ